MDTKQKPKEKRRNNEKRKEKSRDAARCRRSRETEIFSDLSNALPLPQEQISQLDKASIMRLAISYLRVRNMLNFVPEIPDVEKEKCISTNDSEFLKAMDVFVFSVSPEGEFIYVSENVSEFLGVTQIDLMGQNIQDYTHPCDHDEINDILLLKSQNVANVTKSFFIRMKCTLTTKGRSVNLKSATYKVIHCTGHIITNDDDKGMKHCLVSLGQPIPHPSYIEAPLPENTFVTKHNLDMKFNYADEKMLDILGYEDTDLIGKSLYDYHHAVDSDPIISSYKSLFSKGQCETDWYRFLARNGGYIWVKTQATLIYDKMQKPQSVVCVNYVISGIQCDNEIYASFQESNLKEENHVVVNTPEKDNLEEEVQARSANKPIIVTAKIFAQAETPIIITRPQTATSKIFAPRTEEMSKGFLTFSEEEPGLTLLKDEPDDLTHLAPVAGEVVPIDDNPYLEDMLLDDLLLKDGFCPLLAVEPSDPFLSYRSSCDPSPQLLSPNIIQNSECSLSSLNSPTDSLVDDDQISSFISMQMEEDPDLDLKAPYIPMSMSDESRLLMPIDLMWNPNDKNKNDPPDSSSSLAQMLCSNINKHSLDCNEEGSSDKVEDLYGRSKPPYNSNYQKRTNLLLEENSWSKVDDQHDSTSGSKRTNSTTYHISNKRTKFEHPNNSTSELLQQLISNNHNRARPKENNWLLDSGGRKATCVSQPNESVLMNLLNEQYEKKIIQNTILQKQMQILIAKLNQKERDSSAPRIRKSSMSLLDPAAEAGTPSLFDLTQQDYDVNAPVNNYLLQGEDLITALEVNAQVNNLLQGEDLITVLEVTDPVNNLLQGEDLITALEVNGDGM